MPSFAVSVPLTGLSANDPVPGQYVEVNFAQGADSAGTGLRAILIIANKSTAGDATADIAIYGPPSPFVPTAPQPLATVQDSISRFGQGSEAHRMYKRVVAVNQTTPIYVICPLESVGAAATLVVTFAVTATNAGSVRTWVGDDFIDAPINPGDTPTIIAAAVASAVNSKLDWAANAVAAVGVLTITAKNKGLRGNWLRGSSNIVGTGVGTTSSVAIPTFFTGGTTADSNANALATILTQRFYYVVSAAEDATQLGAVLSQIGTQALPTQGLRQCSFAGSIDTLANVTTIATGINSARCEIPWLAQADLTPAELAANYAAVCSLYESSTTPRLNLSGFGLSANDASNWKVRAPRSGFVPSRSQRLTALNNGITTINVLPTGTTYLEKRVTTRSLSGANNDYRIRDPHKVRVCDFFADDWVAKQQAQFQGKVIGDDPVPGQRTPGPLVLTPRVMKAAAWKLIDDYADKFLLQNPDQIKAAVICNREPGTTSRVSTRFALQVIDIADQFGSAIDQI